MTRPGPILRLMQYVPLGRGLKLGPEDIICREFAGALRVAAIEGRLSAVWCHVANELAHGHKTGVAAAKARAFGMHPGVADYLFLWNGGCLALEAKAPKGVASDRQCDFASWCADKGVPYQIFRSADEGLTILEKHGILNR